MIHIKLPHLKILNMKRLNTYCTRYWHILGRCDYKMTSFLKLLSLLYLSLFHKKKAKHKKNRNIMLPPQKMLSSMSVSAGVVNGTMILTGWVCLLQSSLFLGAALSLHLKTFAKWITLLKWQHRDTATRSMLMESWCNCYQNDN